MHVYERMCAHLCNLKTEEVNSLHGTAAWSFVWHSKLAGMNPSAAQELATTSPPSTSNAQENLKVPVHHSNKVHSIMIC